MTAIAISPSGFSGPASGSLAIARATRSRHRSERAAARRRRRFLALAVVAGLGLAAGHAGTALGGSSLAVPERGPRVLTHVVEPGDTLWEIAGELAPGENRRVVVDAIVEARHTSTIVPGETITWLEG